MQLTSLDISANKLDAKALNSFLKQIDRRHSLRYLNIGYNSASQRGEIKLTKPKKTLDTKFVKPKAEEPIVEVKVLEFSSTLAEFLHYSDSLLMIDLSGLGFDFLSAKYVIEKGLRKARALTTCVMKGMSITQEERQEIIGALRHKLDKNKAEGRDCLDMESLVTVDRKEFIKVFDEAVKVQHQGALLSSQLQK